jgi:C4-dicarboxylate-specific signal transduction histidine kinase
MTASIAHEVSQPLAGLLTNSSTSLRLLSGSKPNIEAASEAVRRAVRDATRAAEVVKQLRALFSNKQPFTEPIDLNEVAREVIMLTSHELQRGRVILRSSLDLKLPLVMGDRVQLQQVVMNLLLNAADAMSDVENVPRSLLVSTSRDEDSVVLSVTDVGVGVPADAMDKLFNAFYTTKEKGMGVGLSISESIIRNHEGRIWVTPNQGPGATFSFSLPSIHERNEMSSSQDDEDAADTFPASRVQRN